MQPVPAHWTPVRYTKTYILNVIYAIKKSTVTNVHNVFMYVVWHLVSIYTARGI